MKESKGTFTDPRDGKVYKTVEIGGVVWMAENLNYAAEGSVCYDNDPKNGEKYGRLYDWDTAMKACPDGWRLPTHKEWQALMDTAHGPSSVVTSSIGRGGKSGKNLKATSGWNFSGNGTDEYGFAALPGGNGGSDGVFNDIGGWGYWWSATECGADIAWSWYMHTSFPNASRNNVYKTNLYSVRCVAD